MDLERFGGQREVAPFSALPAFCFELLGATGRKGTAGAASRSTTRQQRPAGWPPFTFVSKLPLSLVIDLQIYVLPRNKYQKKCLPILNSRHNKPTTRVVL